MTQDDSKLVGLARKGDVQAIATLINRRTQQKGVTTKVSINVDCLQLLCEAKELPEQEVLTSYTRNFLKSLRVPGIRRVKLYAREQGEDIPTWHTEFEIVESVLQSPQAASKSVIPVIESSQAVGIGAKTTKSSSIFGGSFQLSSSIPKTSANKLKFWAYIKSRSPKEQLAMGGVVLVWLMVGQVSLNKIRDNEKGSERAPKFEARSASSVCQLAGGNIWSGVQIYLDSACKTPSSTVRGGGSGKVLLLFSTGELEWKDRSAVAQAFVKSSDPAIAAHSWVEIEPPN